MCSESSMQWEIKYWWGQEERMRLRTCFLASTLGRPWDFLRQRFVGLVRSGWNIPIRFVQPTLYLCTTVLHQHCAYRLTGTSQIKGDLPLCTNHRAESFRSLKGVGKVDPATVLTRQLRLLFFFCINIKHMLNIRIFLTSMTDVHSQPLKKSWWNNMRAQSLQHNNYKVSNKY